MALTPSKMIQLGTKAPYFNLINPIDQNYLNLNQLTGEKGTLIVFMCNHCPYVIHLIEHFCSTMNDFKSRGINTIAISSNDIDKYPEDGPEKMILLSNKYNFGFPYLFDKNQRVAKLYDAACTPDFYLFDDTNHLVYRGRYDSSRPGNEEKLTGTDLRNAIEFMLNKKPIPEKQYPSMGCNIKWKE